jgi:hypothetical protein
MRANSKPSRVLVQVTPKTRLYVSVTGEMYMGTRDIISIDFKECEDLASNFQRLIVDSFFGSRFYGFTVYELKDAIRIIISPKVEFDSADAFAILNRFKKIDKAIAKKIFRDGECRVRLTPEVHNLPLCKMPKYSPSSAIYLNWEREYTNACEYWSTCKQISWHGNAISNRIVLLHDSIACTGKTLA